MATKLNKRQLFEKVKDLENQIQTITNTRHNSISIFTETTFMDVLQKIDEVAANIYHVVTENKGLKERIKELEDDHSEMEDRIHYLERKLYSLDMYMTHKNNVDIEKMKASEGDISSCIKDLTLAHENSTLSDDSRIDLLEQRGPLVFSMDGKPINKHVQNTRLSNIDMVRTTGKSLVCKLKKYTLQNSTNMITTPDPVTITVDSIRSCGDMMNSPQEIPVDSFCPSSIEGIQNVADTNEEMMINNQLGDMIEGSIINKSAKDVDLLMCR